ncbi:MAG: hypothetical protein JW763_05740 [candidate division Zixibacteria bacterium]|nr:hypothetical protein [candidate division Zixibacteria bacterium]
MTGQRITLSAIMVLLVCLPVSAQSLPASETGFASYLRAYAGVEDPSLDGVYADQPQDTVKIQNPTVALFKSMFVPGLGQIGNREYVKAAIIIALETTLIGTYIHYYNKTNDRENAFQTAEGSAQTRLFEEYENARDQRNRFGWYTGTLIFLSMFDAYVDAHLAKFPKQKEGLAVTVIPTPNEYVHVGVGYSF